MNLLKFTDSVKSLMGLAGAIAAGTLLAVPALAQLNPRPSIFNEPPYAESSASSAMESAQMTETGEAMDETETPEAMDAPAEPSEMTSGTIADLAASNDSFSTLAAALEAADLVSVLQGEGPYTVFAPTDEAFAALPEGTLDMLLLPENRETLVQILTYHVVPGAVTSDELVSGEVATVEGSPIEVMVGDGSVMVNDATVIQPDVKASNGVIHAIDQVILPPNI